MIITFQFKEIEKVKKTINFISLLLKIQAASNPETESCPLVGSYTLRGLINPPTSSYSSRRKRNHNSKHHHQQQLHDSTIVNNRVVNNRLEVHSPLSFRNEDDSMKSWKTIDRSKSPRQRRSLKVNNESRHHEGAAITAADDEEPLSELSNLGAIDINTEGAFSDVSDDGSEVSNIDDNDVIKLVRSKRNNNNLRIENQIATSNDPSRSRRDTIINCGSNVNTKARQLNIGCSDDFKIDVMPQCNSEGDEGESEAFSSRCDFNFKKYLLIFFTQNTPVMEHGERIKRLSSSHDIRAQSTVSASALDNSYRLTQLNYSLVTHVTVKIKD